MSRSDPSSQEPCQNRRAERCSWLRLTLKRSQQEAAASSAMTATSDNFFNAYAIFLGASLGQMAWVSGLPQLFGAISQLLSVWLASHFSRKQFIVACAGLQALVVMAMGAVAAFRPDEGVWIFIGLAALYHGFINLIQPHWRAWMGAIVPERRRGAFFAARTRLTMGASLSVFFIGGGILTLTDSAGMAWLGFSLLFSIAAMGRFVSARLLWLMHDPEPRYPRERGVFVRTLKNFAGAWKDKTFRHYSLFVAGMQAMVAISAPFFAVYMLEGLKFTYLEFVFASVASICTQFVTLRFWGRFSDLYGNRLVMIITSCLIPSLPLLWLFSDNYGYILAIQAFSGFAWSGFTLSTANYLYDIRPFRSDFATYAALQAALSAGLVFVGAMFGGLIASHAADFLAWSDWDLASPIFVVFLVSTLLRTLVTAWFIPRSVEPKVRPRPQLLQLIFRIRGFNAISGVALDFLTVVKKRKD
ncbi:MFS transporter [Shewanella sedimentimangrovi]|uniref:MFS transporter n=1 Tax=Shewanella sedimentimangrovi TaxID=2814293 RepID=A0ABX7R3Z0_9GAMM|nr:MFS transporter [Shewanella sedimentimangrovi]QSX37535.1 MFS transporter [Shewanella sedimentimangrovi]